MTSTLYELEVEARLDSISPTAAKLLGFVAGFSKGSRGDCRAKAKTLAPKIERSTRTVRRCFRQLTLAGLVVKTTKRQRFAVRQVTETGSAVLARLKAPNRSAYLQSRSVATPPTTTAAAYSPPSGLYKRRNSLDPTAWAAVARWMDVSGDCTSMARAKMAHKRFSAIAAGLERTWEWAAFSHAHAGVSGSKLVEMAAESAIDARARFYTVESAVGYLGAILTDCVRQRRLPTRAPP